MSILGTGRIKLENKNNMLKKTTVYFVPLFFLLFVNLDAKEIPLLCKVDKDVMIVGGNSYSYIIDDRKNIIIDNDRIAHDYKKDKYTISWETQSTIGNNISEFLHEIHIYTGQFTIYSRNYKKEDIMNKDKISKINFKTLYSAPCEKKEKLLD